jgi:hypothetical protein
MTKMHSSEAFYALGDPLEAAVFSVLVELMRELAEEPGGSEANRTQGPKVYRRYLDELGGADVRELAIHRRVSRLNYSRRCTEASAVQAHTKQGLPLAPGMEIAYVVKDAKKWEVDPARTASEFDAGYYRGLLVKAWEEAGFVL